MWFHQKRYLVCQESFICHDKRTHSPEMPPLEMILSFSFKLKSWAKRWILPNHYVHRGSHDMRTRRWSVRRSFAVGSVVWWRALQSSWFSVTCAFVSLSIFLFCFFFQVDGLHQTFSVFMVLLWRVALLGRTGNFRMCPESYFVSV